MTENGKDYKVAKAEPTYSQRFTSAVINEFSAQVGVLELTPLQQRLAQHLFVACDAQLKTLEAKRKDQNALPIIWPNINMAKLAIDAVHRVELGLDALIPNHIHPIPYMNGKTKKYDLDLRIGYTGKDCYKRKMALEEPIDITYELVYSNDEFSPVKKGLNVEIESYVFNIVNPFDRGQVIGGFGYIQYSDPKKNKLVIVSNADFDKSKAKAQTKTFWNDYPREMQFKTLVHRTLAQIPIDPAKVNASFMKVEIDDTIIEADRHIEEGANQDMIDIETGEIKDDEPELTGAQAVKEKQEEWKPPDLKKQKFIDDVRAAANIVGMKKYREILAHYNCELISEVKEEDYDSMVRIFQSAVDEKMKAEEGPEGKKPGF